MRKILLVVALMPLWGHAQAPLEDETYKHQMEYLKNEGVPLPDEGVVLVDKEQLHMPAYILAKHQAEYAEIAKFGYAKQDSPRADELLHFKKIAKAQAKKYSGFQKPYSTTLRASVDEMQFAYTFVGVPKEEIAHFIGIAPVGKYEHGKGWSGGVEFFDDKLIGTCAYTEKNLKITHGSSRIDKDIVTQQVNGKVTLSDARGSDATGYLYQVTWFDLVFERTLECANKKYSSDNMKQLIALANRIDNN